MEAERAGKLGFNGRDRRFPGHAAQVYAVNDHSRSDSGRMSLGGGRAGKERRDNRGEGERATQSAQMVGVRDDIYNFGR